MERERCIRVSGCNSVCHFAAGRAGDTDTLSSLQLCAVHVRVERVELGLRDAVGCPDGVAGLAILHCDHLGACGPSLGAHCLANLHSQRRDLQVNNLLEALCGKDCYGMLVILTVSNMVPVSWVQSTVGRKAAVCSLKGCCACSASQTSRGRFLGHTGKSSSSPCIFLIQRHGL